MAGGLEVEPVKDEKPGLEVDQVKEEKLEVDETDDEEFQREQYQGSRHVETIDLTDVSSEDENHRPRTICQIIIRRAFRMEMLLFWTFLGAVVGVSLGVGLYNQVDKLGSTGVKLIAYPGEMMIRALQLFVLPLVVFALMSGVCSLRASKTGSVRVITWSLCYYLISMVVAILIAIGMLYAINPARGEPLRGVNSSSATCRKQNSALVNETESEVGRSVSVLDTLLNLGRDLVPTDIVQAAAVSNYLGVILFAVIFAAVLVKIGEKAIPIMEGIEVCNQAVMKIISFVILTTPIGIASWIASTILTACDLSELFKSTALFVGTVVSAMAIHFFIALPLALFLIGRRNPYKAMTNWLPAFAMALGTQSTAASMPVSMNCGRLFGCNPAIVNFVIPLGTNINRDGTALYEAIAVIFLCEANGRDLHVGKIIVIVIVATLAAIGTSSIPQAGLVTLIVALEATGNSDFIKDLSVLYAVDWFLGMLRTLLNVWGDACACCTIDILAQRHARKEEASREIKEFVQHQRKGGAFPETFHFV